MGVHHEPDILTEMDAVAYTIFKDFYDAEILQNTTKNILSRKVLEALGLIAAMINLRRMGIKALHSDCYVSVDRRLKYTAVKNIPPFYIGYFPFTHTDSDHAVRVHITLSGVWQTRKFSKEFWVHVTDAQDPAVNLIL